MRDPADQLPPSTSAEEVFLQFLAQREEPGALAIEIYVERYPDLADELRELHGDWQRIAGLVGKLPAQESLQATLATRYGKTLDPGISLDAARDPSDSVLERLEEHTSRRSRYVIKDEIARGGMGVILNAWDQDLRRNLAMKAVLAERVRTDDGSKPEVDEHVLSRFLEEAQITGQLGHPGIVPVHELGLDDLGRVYFTMPLVRGREFKRIISLVRDREEGWNLNRALRVLLKVCEAVAYAHSRGVIHRDLKPANVMVGRFGETYVMDWGLARVLSRKDSRDIRVRDSDPGDSDSDVQTERSSTDATPLETMDGAVIGTPAYMSPEQAAGNIEQLDERTDVYSLGAMLYHLLTYQMPYVARGQFLSPRTVLQARLNGPPVGVLKLNQEAPAELADICEKAMATSPDGRYRTALELAQDVEAFLGDRPVSAHEATLGYQLKLAFRRHRAEVLTAAAALVVLVAATAIFVRNQERAIKARTRAFDVVSARALPERVDELFPATPAKIPELETWLEQTDDLLSREGSWRSELERARDAEHGELSQILAGMHMLPDLRKTVARRLEIARSLEDPEFHDQTASWKAAIESIRSSPKYNGLELPVLDGLLPLGEDRASGLWEFWSPLSGEEPHRDSDTGSIVPRPEDGVVLMLLPGGTYMMGAEPAEDGWRPVDYYKPVTLGPFLAGKYEVTQAQWARIMGTNPSLHKAGLEIPAIKTAGELELIGWLHPVQSLSWFMADEFASRIGLTQLTEEQWEYACRAGSTTYYIWGDEVESLEGMANVLNASCANGSYLDAPAAWDDGYCYVSPIGCFPANPFGLHDMDGNLTEWCEDWYDDDWIQPPSRRNFRGGTYALPPAECMSAVRGFEVPTGGNFGRGMRVGLTIPE